MSKWDCDNCGACCLLRECEHVDENNHCSIFNTRPDNCKGNEVAKMAGLTEQEYLARRPEMCQTCRDFLAERMFQYV